MRLQVSFRQSGLSRAARPNRLLLIALLLCVSSVFAGITGLTERLLDRVAATYGQEAKERLLDWQGLIRSGKDRSEAEKLALVNSFFNRVAFVDDIIHWKKPDYWATPVEMLATNGGDCEDFSIAKYLTLREMGVPDERMLITYVKSIKLNQAHMVLTYYPAPEADPMVLDNLVPEIRPASERSDLLPVYSFNGGGLWLSKERGRGRRVGPSTQISLWRELEARIEKEMGR